VRIPKNIYGRDFANHLIRQWAFLELRQTGSHIILRTEQPFGLTISVPAHKPLRAGTRSRGYKAQLSLAIGLLLVTLPMASAQDGAKAPDAVQATDAKALAFDVVSIKPHKAGDTMMSMGGTPDGYSATNVSMKWMIQNAYGIKMEDLVIGAPVWADSEQFDFTAKMDEETADRMKKLSRDERQKQMSLLLQAMLADRCGLKVHQGTKEISAYALVVAKSGFKLKEADPSNTYPNGITMPGLQIVGAGGFIIGPGKLAGQGITLSTFAANLGSPIDSFVVDKTGIPGKYDIALQWDPNPNAAADGATTTADNGPSLFTALQDQLGLKLVPAKVPMDTVIIDHVDRPSAN
jgi:uncharacterized protein (TIGR03435 family)